MSWTKTLRYTRAVCQRRRHGFRSFAAQQRQGSGPFDVLFLGSDSFSVASLQAVMGAEGKLVGDTSWTDLTMKSRPLEIHTCGHAARTGHWSGSKTAQREYRAIYSGVWHIYSDKLADGRAAELLTFSRENDLPISHVPPEGINHYAVCLSPPRRTEKLKRPQPPTAFQTLAPDSLLLTASFGHILPSSLLAFFSPDHRLNVHPSLLPRYRGAAPIQWTIANGDAETGVSVQQLVEKGKGIDGGEIVGYVDGVQVPDDATYHTLLPGLARLGGDLLVKVLREIRDGRSTTARQVVSQITRAPKITNQTAEIDWRGQTSFEISRLSRGISHQYPLWTLFQSIHDTPSLKIQLLDPKPSVSLLHGIGESDLSSAVPGTAILHKGAMYVVCKDATWLVIDKVKPEGKPLMKAWDWGAGRKEFRQGGVRFRR